MCGSLFIRALIFGLTFRNHYADSVCEIENDDDEIIREDSCTLMLANFFRGSGESQQIQNVHCVAGLLWCIVEVICDPHCL